MCKIAEVLAKNRVINIITIEGTINKSSIIKTYFILLFITKCRRVSSVTNVTSVTGFAILHCPFGCYVVILLNSELIILASGVYILL